MASNSKGSKLLPLLSTARTRRFGTRTKTTDNMTDTPDHKNGLALGSEMVGKQLPHIQLYELGADSKVDTVDPRELYAGKLGVLAAIPGAFTPVCSAAHLPETVSNYDNLTKEGIQVISFVSVNDPFVMDAWGKQHNATGKVRMLADPDATFTCAMGATFLDDLKFKGPRSRRYSALLQDNKIVAFNLEPETNPYTISSVAVLLRQLQELKQAGKLGSSPASNTHAGDKSKEAVTSV